MCVCVPGQINLSPGLRARMMMHSQEMRHCADGGDGSAAAAAGRADTADDGTGPLSLSKEHCSRSLSFPLASLVSSVIIVFIVAVCVCSPHSLTRQLCSGHL